MPRVQTTFFQGQTSQPKLSPGVAAKSAEGLQGLLGSVSNTVGEIKGAYDHVQATFAELQKKEEDSELEDIEYRYKKDHVENFDAWTATEHDTDKWLERSDGLHNDFLSGVEEERSRSPEFKRRISDRLRTLKQANDLRLLGKAASLKGQQINKRYKDSIDYAVDTGDPAKARELAEKWRNSGYLNEDSFTQINRHIERTSTIQGFKDLVERDPRQVSKLKKPAGLHVSDWERIQKGAESQIARNERDSVKKISDLLDGGQIADRGELEDLLKADKNISEDKRKIFLHSYEQNEPLDFETKKRLREGFDDIKEKRQAGTITEEEYELQHHQLSSEVYALGSRSGSGGLRSQAHRLDPSNWQDVSQNVREAGVKGKIEDLNKISRQWAKDGGYGGADDEDNEALAREANQEALALQEKVERDIEGWIEQNPEATFDEISSEFRKRVTKEASESLFKEPDNPYLDYVQPKRLPPVSVNTSAHKSRADIPYNGVAANVRYNNPGAAWPREADNKYGLIGYGILKDGENNRIGRFPTPVHGAAANFDLFAAKYEGMTFQAAMNKWRGRKSPVPKGYPASGRISKQFLDDPEQAIDFFKKMALHESPTFKGMSNTDWKAAWQMWKNGGANV